MVENRLSAVALAVVLAAGLAGCGSSESASSQAPSVNVPTVGAPASAAPAVKVSANEATEEELSEAFAAAGILNSDQWADEVAEYRPYPADDPDFTKLRTGLAKYNPSPGVVDQIVSVLTP